MPEIEVGVYQGGREICRVVRPLHILGRTRIVVYKRKRYQVRRGNLIDLDKGCFEAEPPAPAQRALASPATTARKAPSPHDGNGKPSSLTHNGNGTRVPACSRLGMDVTAPPAPRAGRPCQAVDDTRDREAIRSAGAGVRMLVEAGPGTGKTEMAALRLAGLLRLQLSPGQILVLSFSRSAVRTLTRRLSRVADPEDRLVEELRHVSIRTFDSWAFRLLRLLGRPPAALLARAHDENIAELTSLIAGNHRDEVRTLIGDRRHLIVDEFQDLPGVRGELVLGLLDLLAPPGRPGCGFTILGDPAQAIYGFAARSGSGGSFPGPAVYWKRVLSAYGPELEVRTLRRNHRAAASLAALSAELRAVLLSPRPDEEKLRVVRDAIAGLPAPAQPAGPEWLQRGEPGSRAVLTRTNGEALRVLQKLLGSDVEGPPTPVRLRAGSYAPLPPAWIAALLRRLRSPALTRSQFRKIFAHLAGQWDEATRQRLGLPSEEAAWVRLTRASGAAEDASAIQVPDLRARLNWPDAFPDDQPVSDEGVIVTTIHQSKGMEFDVVTVLDTGHDEDEGGAGERDTEEQSAAEEANVGYVAVSRAGQVLTRIDGGDLFQAPRSREFQNGRRRLCCRRGGWVNLEMGLRGDIDPFGFVDPALHGGAKGVEALQDFLLRGARRLEGHKVMLCKHTADGKVAWHVHMQNGRAPDRLIGRTAPQLTFDLLYLLRGKGLPLPRTIMNLRIAAVGTVTSDAEFRLEEPERSSRLWLGVSLFGTGDFQTPRKKS